MVIEDLKASNMMHNHHLARAMANRSWRRLRTLLAYKCQWAEKTLITVAPHLTSQTCSACGGVLPKTQRLTLADRHWTCPQCGRRHDRDVNAARNILQKGLEQAVVQ